ncbi:hypothetical protein AB00_4739 [Raoultella ornithinolytica 2-156-04_S1_C1]|nr:hypothetical protein AB00_4739 [Raoultella ornithinolytica 2-156-04_S1_C1]
MYFLRPVTKKSPSDDFRAGPTLSFFDLLRCFERFSCSKITQIFCL